MSLRIKIHEIINETIQGEGFYSGQICDFVRLFGCPVGCSFCDTGYSQDSLTPKYYERKIDEILDQLRSNFVVISGGEPTINPGFDLLVSRLLESGYQVSVETSGIAPIKQSLIDSGLWITLSPKDHVSDYKSVDQVWKSASEVKIVVTEDLDPISFYAEKLNTCQTTLKFLQPEWETHDYERTINFIRKNPEWKLSTQTHKFIGVA